MAIEKQESEVIEEIATNISKLSRQVGAILGGRVKQDTVVTLLVHSTKLSRSQVKAVLEAIVNLEKDHLKK